MEKMEIAPIVTMKLIQEEIDLKDYSYVIEESTDGKKTPIYKITGNFLRIGVRNINGNLYTRPVVEKAVEEFNRNWIATGRACGEFKHPHKPFVNMDNICIRITKMWIEGDEVKGEAIVLTGDGSHGDKLASFIKGGLVVGVSLRAVGTFDSNKIMGDNFRLIAIDVVYDPSESTAMMDYVMESKREYTMDKMGNLIEVVDVVQEETKKSISQLLINAFNSI